MTQGDTCSIHGCNASSKTSRMTHGWCSKHYQRWRKHGDPLGDPDYLYETRLVSHLLVAPNLSTTPSDLARNTRRCLACAQTHGLLNGHRTAGHPDSTFNFQAISDVIYNRITGLIPEQNKTELHTSTTQGQLHTETLRRSHTQARSEPRTKETSTNI